MMNAGRAEHRRRSRLPQRIGAVLALVCATGAQAADPAPATLTFNVTTVAATCHMALVNGETSGIVSVGRLSPAAFTATGSTPAQSGGSFTLRLTDCGGAQGSLQPQLSVWGDQTDVTGTQYLFRAADSTSTNAGMALWYAVNNASLAGPTGKRVLASGSAATPTLLELPEWSGPDTNLEGKVVAFWAGLSNEGLSAVPTTGSVNATLHFRFFYQ
ncbi:TPA: fimbrial protein [Serratia liquefaciens]